MEICKLSRRFDADMDWAGDREAFACCERMRAQKRGGAMGAPCQVAFQITKSAKERIRHVRRRADWPGEAIISNRRASARLSEPIDDAGLVHIVGRHLQFHPVAGR